MTHSYFFQHSRLFRATGFSSRSPVMLLAAACTQQCVSSLPVFCTVLQSMDLPVCVFCFQPTAPSVAPAAGCVSFKCISPSPLLNYVASVKLCGCVLLLPYVLPRVQCWLCFLKALCKIVSFCPTRAACLSAVTAALQCLSK